MATIAEQIGERASQQGDAFGKGVNEVMGVANFVQRTQQNRQNLEAQKQSMEIQKSTVAINSLHSALKFKGSNRNLALKSVGARLSQMIPGFNEDILATMKDEEAANEVLKTIAPMVTGGTMDIQTAGIINNTLKLDPVAFLEKMQEFGAERSKTERAALSSGLRQERFAETKKKTAIGQEDNLRKSLTSHPVSKDTMEVISQFDRVSLLKKGTPASDIAGIFAFMKVLDPRSTVREGEFATAANAGSVPTKISNLYNKIRKGTRLTNEQRKDFIDQAATLKTRQLEKQGQLNTRFGKLATDRGLDFDAVLAGTTLEKQKEEAPELPAGLSAAVPKLKEGYAALPPEKQPLMLQQLSTRFKLPVEQIKQLLGVK